MHRACDPQDSRATGAVLPGPGGWPARLRAEGAARGSGVDPRGRRSGSARMIACCTSEGFRLPVVRIQYCFCTVFRTRREIRPSTAVT